MASNVAPPKNTGGGGFVFEDDVCAWLSASMLVGEPVFGADCGPPVRLDFQTRPGPDGWFLDDVLVTTAVGAIRHRFALSVKSNAQFTATSAPFDFVAAAWEQWLHLGSAAFDASLDFMGLVTAPLSGAAASSVSGLVEKVRANDPSLFPSRLAEPNWANADERSLFASFACPASLGQTTTAEDTARLLQRVRFLQRDFGAVASESQNSALELCRRAVRSHVATDAQALWSILREVTSELRPRAGSLTLIGLVDRLRARVALADYPDHVGDWTTLDARSAREVGLVRDSIAGRVRLPRETEVTHVIASLVADVQVVLLGPSGVGKSALARTTFERRHANGERTLWVDASSLDRAADFGALEASLQLRHPLNELFANDTSRDPLVIIDGLDRLYSDHAFRNVASLLRLGIGESTTRWRVLAVCQSQEWPRVLEALQRAGAPRSRWRIHEAKAPQLGDLQPVRDVVPALGRLLLQPRVGALLTNLKLLDLVVRRLDGGTDIDASAWVGESSVAEWFWNAEIDRGVDRLARGQFARSLAQAQADQLVASVSVDSLEASTLLAAQSLIADTLLVQVPGDCIAFAHDLYGDWARLRVLLNHRADLATFLQSRYVSPLWHRAIRLLALHLLERENGVAEWKTLMSSFESGDMAVVRDLLLEAPAFAMNAGTLLDGIFPDLVAGDGALLRRLLTRFLAFATVPKEEMVEFARSVGVDVNTARAAYRRPHWPYWLDLLAVLHAHRDTALRAAACEIAKIVEMWLEFVPHGSIRRPEAAALAVMLGQRALDSRDDWRGRESHEDRQRFYRCALLAAPEQPDEVAHIARVAAERVPRPASEAVEAPARPRPRSILDSGVMRGPWLDGPLAHVDEDFQTVILDHVCIRHLYGVRPAIAREVILATLISAPYEEQWGGGRMHQRELDLVHHRWLPALFTRGPFLLCLRENFDEGLEMIMRLVEFATERSNEYSARELDEWRARAVADGRSEAEIREAEKRIPPQFLLLNDGTNELRFSGDVGSYAWSAGHTSRRGYAPLPPSAVTSALMALEQYFYQRLDAGQDVTEAVTRTLARSRTVAPLGVLIDVGKRQVSLFDAPLRALLSAPELYAVEIEKLVHGRTHLMIGGFDDGQHVAKLAQQFHGLEHRKRDLRHVAMERLLKSEAMQTFFSSVREWWKRRRADGELLIEMTDQLDLRLDPANYQVRDDPTHGLVVINVALERLQLERAHERQAIDDRMLVTGFPIRCRTILDERQLQTDVQLEELWQTWLRVRDLAKAGLVLSGDEERFGDEYVNAIAGGIAVFLWHDEWLSRNDTHRHEVTTALATITEDVPAREGLASEHDASTWSWDCFLAEAAAMLWAREPRDARWRRLVAEMVFAEKYVTLRLLFSRCAEYRTALGEDFGRLRRLATDMAHVRDRIDLFRRWQHMGPQTGEDQVRERLHREVTNWAEQAIASFVAGTLAPNSADWNRFGEASRFAEIDTLRHGWPDSRFMDFHAVRCCHEWLPLPDEALSPEERAEIIQFWRVALDVVTARPRADLHRREHQYPHEDEQWVLQNVARVVLQLHSPENPALFWATIIDLHTEAHDWPQDFLNALHRRALSSEQTPATYGPLVRQIAQRAFADVDGARRWPWHEEVWDAVIGIDGWVKDMWADRHADHVYAIWDVISLWMEKAPQDGRRLAKFARWLSKPAAAAIRLRTLAWFLRLLQVEEERSLYRDEDADDDLAKLLNVVWDQDQSGLRAASESFSAFRGLLAWLVERQNSLGLELQGRIGGLT